MIGIYYVLGTGPLLQVNDITGIVPRAGDHVKTAIAEYLVEGVEWHLTNEKVTIWLSVIP